MSAEDWTAWVGRTETVTEDISPWRVGAFAASLDWERAPARGEALPPGWHWLFFNPTVRRSQVGPDGHPKRGGFLPPITLPRRMWAGGRVNYLAPIPVGADAAKHSEILKVESKSGKSGDLTFVTVRHVVEVDGVRCVDEEQDIVYRSPPLPGAPPPPKTPAPQGAQWSEEVAPDEVLLFRYSALTFNGHRIHYDQPYATSEEGYPGLVFHGPFTSTLLQDLAVRARPAMRLSQFSYRGAAPLFVDRAFRIEAAPVDGKPNELSLWAKDPDGNLAMPATAVFVAK